MMLAEFLHDIYPAILNLNTWGIFLSSWLIDPYADLCIHHSLASYRAAVERIL